MMKVKLVCSVLIICFKMGCSDSGSEGTDTVSDTDTDTDIDIDTDTDTDADTDTDTDTDIDTDTDTDTDADTDTDDSDSSEDALVAFPGASGGGAVSVGGRGGIVIEVTNLNDSGAGSFREACMASGARTVVFRVGGTITLTSAIVVENSYLTIAGQTAPGDGIMIRSSEGVTQTPLLFKNSHDIVIRYIRVRPGPYANEQAGDAIGTYIHAHNIIIDHCSLSWATDENTELFTNEDPGHNFTWSWNLIAEALMPHSCGLLAGTNINADGMLDVSVHHNMFVHNHHRNPLIKVKTADVVNNIIFGWEQYATQIGGGLTIDIIGNKYVEQPGLSGTRREVLWKPYTPGNAATGPSGDPSIYFEGNTGPNNSNPTADAWAAMMEMTDIDHWGYPDDDGSPDCTDIPAGYRRYSIRPSDYPIIVDDVTALDSLLMDSLGVGACMQLDENGNRVPNRGIVDTRIVEDYINCTGIIPDTVEDAGGFPDLQNGTPYTDNDHDGMADTWETANGLNPDDASDRNDTDLSPVGYTNLEIFLHGID